MSASANAWKQGLRCECCMWHPCRCAGPTCAGLTGSGIRRFNGTRYWEGEGSWVWEVSCGENSWVLFFGGNLKLSWQNMPNFEEMLNKTCSLNYQLKLFEGGLCDHTVGEVCWVLSLQVAVNATRRILALRPGWRPTLSMNETRY